MLGTRFASKLPKNTLSIVFAFLLIIVVAVYIILKSLLLGDPDINLAFKLGLEDYGSFDVYTHTDAQKALSNYPLVLLVVWYHHHHLRLHRQTLQADE